MMLLFWEFGMVLPVYQVEFIPSERRLGPDRRMMPPDTPLPPGVFADRRKSCGRRAGDAERHAQRAGSA